MNIRDYALATERAAALQARDDETVNPLCRTRLLTHGRRAERAIVLWHGFTNCPQQWLRLGQEFFGRGYNVLIPRLPQHGLADRLTYALASLRVEELIASAGEALDIARGLGERVAVVGLSLGGTLALWTAQNRADMDLVVAIAPLIVPRNVPPLLVPTLTALARRLPDFYVWWDPATKAAMPGPRHAYPGFSSRGLAELLRLARLVESASREPRALPRAQFLLVVTNANDPALDNRATDALVARYRANGARAIESYTFDATLRLVHDIVDEQQVAQQTAIVYPLLLELIEKRMGAA